MATLCTVQEVTPCACQGSTAVGLTGRVCGGATIRRRKSRFRVVIHNQFSELEDKEDKDEPPSLTDSESEVEDQKRPPSASEMSRRRPLLVNRVVILRVRSRRLARRMWTWISCSAR